MADEGVTGEKAGDEAGTDSPDIKALRREKEELGLRAEIAASRRTLVGLGLSGVKTPEGEIKIDGETPIEGVILSYRALESVAAAIAERVAGAQPDPSLRVVLHDAAIFKGISVLSALREQLDLLDAEATALIGEVSPAGGLETVAGAALPTAGALISSAVELVSLFRKDVTLNYGKVEPADRTLAVAVAGALTAKGVVVIDSAMVPIDPAGGTKGSTLSAKLQALHEKRTRLAAMGRSLASTRKARATKLQPEAAAPEGADAPAADEETPQEMAVSAMVAALGTFLDTLLKVDEATGAARLAQMLDAEKLEARLDPKTVFLWLKVDAAGGASRVTKSLFSSAVDYSGGAVASFSLYGRDGVLRAAGTVPRYTGFVTLVPKSPPRGLLPGR